MLSVYWATFEKLLGHMHTAQQHYCLLLYYNNNNKNYYYVHLVILQSVATTTDTVITTTTRTTTTITYNYNNPYCGAGNFFGLAVKGLKHSVSSIYSFKMVMNPR